MKRLLAPLAVLALLAAASACDVPLGDGYDYGSLSVAVLDTTGVGIPGVRLTLEAIGYRDLDYGTTDASGRHVFEWLTGGGRALEVEVPEGYEPAEGQRTRIPFPAADGENLSFAIILQPVSDTVP